VPSGPSRRNFPNPTAPRPADLALPLPPAGRGGDVPVEAPDLEPLAADRGVVEPADGVVVVEAALEGRLRGDRPDEHLTQLQLVGDGLGERGLARPRLARHQQGAAEEQGGVDHVDRLRSLVAEDQKPRALFVASLLGVLTPTGGAGNQSISWTVLSPRKICCGVGGESWVDSGTGDPPWGCPRGPRRGPMGSSISERDAGFIVAGRQTPGVVPEQAEVPQGVGIRIALLSMHVDEPGKLIRSAIDHQLLDKAIVN